jgi:hypothetical protein
MRALTKMWRGKSKWNEGGTSKKNENSKDNKPWSIEG